MKGSEFLRKLKDLARNRGGVLQERVFRESSGWFGGSQRGKRAGEDLGAEKGLVTDGATIKEALVEAGDALSEALTAAIEANEDIPSPSHAKRGQVVVAPDPTVALKAALHMAKRRYGVRTADIARKLKLDHKDARRLLDVRHPSVGRESPQCNGVSSGGQRDRRAEGRFWPPCLNPVTTRSGGAVGALGPLSRGGLPQPERSLHRAD